MAVKIMLVEDDTNLSDIYKARLEAEGYQILIANDGEAALALAVKEKPELIISDVMMPKISGFDMLDILRGTEGIKDTKVIMMTALGQAEDKARAEKLGADRYLVKSQVTLEDVIKTVHDVLGDGSASSTTATDNSATATPPDASSATPSTASATPPVQIPVAAPPDTTAAAVPAAQSQPSPVAEPPAPAQSSNAQAGTPAADSQSAVLNQIQDFVDKQESNSTSTESATSQGPQTAPELANSDQPAERKNVIQPIANPTPQPDLNTLLAKEETGQAASSGQAPAATGSANTASPGNIISPSNSTGPNDSSAATDPNKIAL